MNLTKFLLLDCGIIILGIPLLLLFHGNKTKASLLEKVYGANNLNATYNSLPSQQKLLELEKAARKDGIIIKSPSLVGLWKFLYVWKQGSNKEDLISSSLLRVFSASLEIKEAESNQFAITNSIQFGLLSIQFSGAGNLIGKQPLLAFFFDCIELKAGTNILLSRSLEIPEEKNRPFFGLISIEKDSKWLSARGRGGGLALWVKDN